jgi:hypothetical protein
MDAQSEDLMGERRWWRERERGCGGKRVEGNGSGDRRGGWELGMRELVGGFHWG